MRRTLCITLIVAALLGLMDVAAQTRRDIQVVALFSGKAVIVIDGQRHILSEGQSSPEGITLIEADSKRAILEIEGERRSFPLGQRIGANYAKPSAKGAVVIYRDSGGMFHGAGAINGFAVNFLVDTGASMVAMNSGHAKRIGINYREQGNRIPIATASGQTMGYRVMLDSVRLGDITLNGIEAVVIEGGSPGTILLGSTFLSRVHTQNDGRVMEIRKKY